MRNTIRYVALCTAVFVTSATFTQTTNGSTAGMDDDIMRPSTLRQVLNWLLIALTIGALLVSANAIAEEETPQMVTHNAIGRDDIAVRLQPLGFGLMGDKIDPDTGAVVFSVTDVSIPGNSKLEVAVRRRTGNWNYTDRVEHLMADWILDVPTISMFVRASRNWSNSRCSKAHNDPAQLTGTTTTGISDEIGTPPYGGYIESAYWDGVKLHIPG